MVRYLETFYRHRLLVLTPVLLAVVFGVALVLLRPSLYQSSAKIWLNGPAMESGVPASSSQTQAEQQAAVIREFLSTRAFTAEVGVRSGLADYLSQASPQSGPLSGLRSLVGASGWSAALGASHNRLDDAVYDVLNRNVKVTADGPQIVAISFDAPSARVAQSTLRGLIDQYTDEVLKVRRAQSQAVVDFFQQQVTEQAKTLAAADARVAQYAATLRSSKTAATDLTLVALQRADDLARQRYEGLLLELDQAKLDQSAQTQAGGTGIRLIDPPNLPAAHLGRTSALLRTGLASLAAGLLIMLFSLLALTAADTSLHNPDDVRRALGLRLVGAIPRLRQANP
jgi:uncharacterized protein involved in exopolysaccharide biosynthesis